VRYLDRLRVLDLLVKCGHLGGRIGFWELGRGLGVGGLGDLAEGCAVWCGAPVAVVGRTAEVSVAAGALGTVAGPAISAPLALAPVPVRRPAAEVAPRSVDTLEVPPVARLTPVLSAALLTPVLSAAVLTSVTAVPVVAPVGPRAEPAPVTSRALVAAIIPVTTVLPVGVTGFVVISATAVTSIAATTIGAVARAELTPRAIGSRPAAIGVRAARFALVRAVAGGSGRLAAEATALAATCRLLLATSPVV
jgi:hypothetical protein